MPHLGGIEVGYKLSSLDPAKPTLVLINPFTTTVDYYLPEFENRQLTDRLNLLAVEPISHGATRAKTETFTYWDSAIVFLQLLDALGVERAFVAGTSQGGVMAAQMALLAPQRVSSFALPSVRPADGRFCHRSKVSSRSAHRWIPSPPKVANWVAGMAPEPR